MWIIALNIIDHLPRSKRAIDKSHRYVNFDISTNARNMEIKILIYLECLYILLKIKLFRSLNFF